MLDEHDRIVQGRTAQHWLQLVARDDMAKKIDQIVQRLARERVESNDGLTCVSFRVVVDAWFASADSFDSTSSSSPDLLRLLSQ